MPRKTKEYNPDKSVVVSFRMTAAVVARLDALAVEWGCDRAHVAERFVRRGLEQEGLLPKAMSRAA